jgi:hypothetical protein
MFPEIGEELFLSRHTIKSGAVFSHLLLRVGDGALQGLDVVAFGLVDDSLDGAGHGWLDFGGG